MPPKYPAEYHRKWREKQGKDYAQRQNEKVKLYHKTVIGRMALKVGAVNNSVKHRGGRGRLGQKDMMDVWRSQGGKQLNNKVLSESLCAVCESKLSTFGFRGMIVDHIKPLKDGGLNIRNNIRLLCWECHKVKTKDELHQMSPWYERRRSPSLKRDEISGQQFALEI